MERLGFTINMFRHCAFVLPLHGVWRVVFLHELAAELLPFFVSLVVVG